MKKQPGVQYDIAFDVDANGDGILNLVYHPQDERAQAVIRLLGQVLTDERAGYVWPKHPVKRAAFRLLRRVFGDAGRVAAWTRRWRGPWVVVAAKTGRQIGTIYFSHALAVESEVRWSLSSSAWF